MDYWLDHLMILPITPLVFACQGIFCIEKQGLATWNRVDFRKLWAVRLVSGKGLQLLPGHAN